MFPAEIIDWIFTYLQRDPDALKSCSTAHPLLSRLAERHFFVHVIFYVGPHFRSPGPTDGFPVSKFSRCLEERPHLANHTRSITIDGSAASSSYPHFKELSSLLPLISRSERISLRHVGWHEFPVPLRSALLGCLRKPGMKELCLHNSRAFPLSILNDFRDIKNLELGSSGSSFKYHPLQTTLTSLSLVDVDFTRYIAWAGSKLNSLTALRVKAKAPFPDLYPIFTSCKESLTSLTLDIGTFFRTAYRMDTHVRPCNDFQFELSTLACLEVVTIYAMLGADDYPIQGTCDRVRFSKGCNSSLPAITELVNSAGPFLNHLILNLDFRVGGAQYLHDGMEWKPLIQLCNSLRHLQVDLCIRAWTSHGWLPFVEVVDSLVQSKDLLRLIERGSLVIEPFPLDC